MFLRCEKRTSLELGLGWLGERWQEDIADVTSGFVQVEGHPVIESVFISQEGMNGGVGWAWKWVNIPIPPKGSKHSPFGTKTFADDIPLDTVFVNHVSKSCKVLVSIGPLVTNCSPSRVLHWNRSRLGRPWNNKTTPGSRKKRLIRTPTVIDDLRPAIAVEIFGRKLGGRNVPRAGI